MESKIRIKLGPIEVDYEGSEAFLKQELPSLIKTVTELSLSWSRVEDENDQGEGDKRKGGKTLQLSTNSIAAKLPCSSGPDLILAAATHLTLVKGQDVFTRKQLLDEMKTASGYYKATYRDNLSSYLKTLLKADSLTESSPGRFSLGAKTRGDMRGRLANRT